MSTIKANTLLHSDGTSTTQPSIPALDKRMAKAFCRWNMANVSTGTLNGTGDVYGFSSITDTGTGNQTVNFTNPMPNTTYVALVTGNAVINWIGVETAVNSTNAAYVQVYHRENNTVADATLVSLVVFGE